MRKHIYIFGCERMKCVWDVYIMRIISRGGTRTAVEMFIDFYTRPRSPKRELGSSD